MRFRALVYDTCRELFYRRTLIFYFGIVTVTHLLLLLAMQTDVADGVITSIKVFGLQAGGGGGEYRLGDPSGGVMAIDAATVAAGIERAVAWMLYPIGVILGLFATASLVPRMLEKGSIDLLLSKPVSRPALLVGRWLGGFLVAAANMIYLVGGVGAILGYKLGVWHWGFLLSGVMMAAYFGALLGFLVLWGVLLRSTTIGIMLTVMVYFVSLAVRAPHSYPDWANAITSKPARILGVSVVEVLYHLLPRTWDFGMVVTNLLLHRPIDSWMPLVWTMLSGLGALAVAVFWFRRTDF
ncbi:MAG TPA: ABC transporter permease subunit [Candidatus Polarisedimenticolia bacterium]|nr:ABC transporter permease subunit [Candidatus Polarisedimenticolia bacterium]